MPRKKVIKPTPKPTTKKPTLYRSKRLRLYHPYQNIRFEPGIPTACEKDSWLEAQIKAGLIE